MSSDKKPRVWTISIRRNPILFRDLQISADTYVFNHEAKPEDHCAKEGDFAYFVPLSDYAALKQECEELKSSRDDAYADLGHAKAALDTWEERWHNCNARADELKRENERLLKQYQIMCVDEANLRAELERAKEEHAKDLEEAAAFMRVTSGGRDVFKELAEVRAEAAEWKNKFEESASNFNQLNQLCKLAVNELDAAKQNCAGLLEALEFYADKTYWNQGAISEDSGEFARDAITKFGGKGDEK